MYNIQRPMWVLSLNPHGKYIHKKKYIYFFFNVK